MNQPPLNPDALEAAADAVIDASFGQELPEAPIDLATAAVSAYLAAALPEVTSVEELEALPLTSVVRTHNGWVYELRGFGWVATGLSDAVAHIDVLDFFPARVLYRPEVNDA